jgi:hypothetical protein
MFMSVFDLTLNARRRIPQSGFTRLSTPEPRPVERMVSAIQDVTLRLSCLLCRSASPIVSAGAPRPACCADRARAPRHRATPCRAPASRRTAGAAGFFILSQSVVRPDPIARPQPLRDDALEHSSLSFNQKDPYPSCRPSGQPSSLLTSAFPIRRCSKDWRRKPCLGGRLDSHN